MTLTLELALALALELALLQSRTGGGLKLRPQTGGLSSPLQMQLNLRDGWC